MAMSDCEKCWDTPCGCGWEYRDYSKDRRIYLAAMVLGIDLELFSVRTRSIVPEEHPMKEV